MAPPPTLVVFTLGAAVEARRRALLPTHARTAERALYQATLDRTLAAGRRAGLPVSVASPCCSSLGSSTERSRTVREIRQPSGTFSERLIGSIALARGASQRGWIVVGSDCPDLDHATLQDVARKLARHPRRVILGPALDGGVYLIAANGCPRSLLAKVSWGHRRTRESLCRALAALGLEVEQLPPLEDLDDRGALRRWLDSAVADSPSWVELARTLRRALQPAAFLPRWPEGRARDTLHRAWAGRAPPL